MLMRTIFNPFTLSRVLQFSLMIMPLRVLGSPNVPCVRKSVYTNASEKHKLR